MTLVLVMSVGMTMASSPGSTVWQNDTILPTLFTT